MVHGAAADADGAECFSATFELVVDVDAGVVVAVESVDLEVDFHSSPECYSECAYTDWDCQIAFEWLSAGLPPFDP